MRSLNLARKKRKTEIVLSAVDVVLTQADVSPSDKKKLRGILKWMMQSPHPFTKCHKALLAHGWSDERAKKTCAVLKDVATGTTKWRNANSKLSVYAVDLAEIASYLSPLSEEEALLAFADCGCGANLSEIEEELEKPTEESPVVLSLVSDDEMVAISKNGVAKLTSPREGVVCLSANTGTIEVDVPDSGSIREVYDELRPSIDLADDQELLVEFVSDFPGVNLAKSDDRGLVWKTILRTGRWKVGPWSTQDKDVPMKVVASGPSDPKNCVISLEEIKKSFDDGAKEHVTVPLTKENDALTHNNRSFDNTGFVRKLRIEKSGNDAVLVAGIEFTDPNVRQKALDGSLADVSGGIKYNHRRKRDGKRYLSMLDHVAITNDPWVDGMKPFGQVAASQDGSEDLEVVVAHLSADTTLKKSSKYEGGETSTLKSVSGESDTEVSASQATTEGGDDVAESTEPAVMDAEAFLKEIGCGSMEELRDKLALAERSDEELRRRDIRDTKRDWEENGVPPAVIAAAIPFLEGDDGAPALNLSQDGEMKGVTVSEVVKTVVAACPTVPLEDRSPGVKLSSDRPTDEEVKLTTEQKAEKLETFLKGGELDLSVPDEGGED